MLKLIEGYMTKRKASIQLTHQIAELVTIALAEIYIARNTDGKFRNTATTIENLEEILLQIRKPLHHLMVELASAPISQESLEKALASDFPN